MSAVYADSGSVIPHGLVSYFNIRLTSDGQGGYLLNGQDNGIKEKFSLTKLHGWLFWLAWGLFGLVQPVSARYMKTWWRANMWIHRISGTFILLVTIAMGLVGISKVSWTLSGANAHYVTGLIIFFATLFIALGGVYARSMTRRLKWQTRAIHRIQGIHKMFGRLMIILAQVTILLGVIQWNENYSTYANPLGIVNIVVYFGIVLILEFVFQLVKLSKPLPYKTPIANMTLEEFNQRSALEGLVLLDDLVLDVSDYMNSHPGGKFVMEHTIGTDVSKFFYGGYALDGNDRPGMAKSHAHTNIARSVVNSLVIARFVGGE